VLRHVRSRLPREDLVYLADQAHVPYGDRSEDDLAGLLAGNVAFLEAAGVDAIVMGCNTSCAVAARRGWPPASVPILDLIEAAADEVVARTPARRIGVIATTATARSGAYGAAIRKRAPRAAVYELAAPALVPLVEAGESETERGRAAVLDVVAEFPAGVDALVYGCTHYPLLDQHFAAALPDVARIDPAREQARAVLALNLPPANGTTLYVTNGDVALFEQNIRHWTGDQTGRVTGLATSR